MTLLAPYLAACLLLAGAGTVKAVRPADTARALGVALPGVPARAWVPMVRLLAATEAVLGVAGLISPNRALAAVVGASYAGFTLVVAYARARRGPLASCGCFGTPDTPATAAHLVVDAGLALSCAVVAWASLDGSITAVLSHQPGDGVPLAGISLLAAWLAFLVMAPLARLSAARALVRHVHRPAGTAEGAVR